MFAGIGAALVSAWNLVPGVIHVANNIVHVVHETIHAVGTALTITLK